MAKIGSEAPVGANAKLGSKAWGAEGSAPSGEVLFDGTVTLESFEAPVPIELDSPLILGASVSIELNGAQGSGSVEQIEEGVIGVTIRFGEETVQIVTASGQGTFFFASEEPAVIGDNSLKIVQSE